MNQIEFPDHTSNPNDQGICKKCGERHSAFDGVDFTDEIDVNGMEEEDNL